MTNAAGHRYTSLDTLGHDGRAVLYRALREHDRRPVLLKVLDPRRCGPDDVERLRREHALATSLDLPVIAKPLGLEAHEGLPALVLADGDLEPLERLLGAPLPPERFLEIAVGIAGALAELHERGVVHKDVKPENVLVHPQTLQVKLTDFGIATRLPRERQDARPPELIEGSLPYMSPEQTGRMNRALDSRTDLYSLGVTFYRMLTGRLPFEAGDPLEWIHRHVARAPAPPSSLVPEVPGPISRIVEKLLAKMAEDRYQTARGLQRDLARCLEEWRRSGRIDPFSPGERDVPDRLNIPQKLYGRGEQLHELLSAFERVLRTGSSELVLVSGPPGIGKSSLVRELHRPIVARQGLFASGKFDPYARGVPYSTLVTALRDLVLGVLAGGEDRTTALRRRLERALHQNARLVVEVIPELELVMGEQPPVPELPPTQAQNRFRAVFRSFLGAFADDGRPLVLFLDDLQWADPASLELLEDVVTHSSLRSTLVVGAYRDGEVTPAHPLALAIGAARKAGALVSEIALGPLSPGDLAAFLADALRCRCEDGAPLAEVVSEKTAANPFFAIQFLTALEQERLIGLDREGRWTWDLARIRARGFTDNVVEFMISRLARLPAPEQRALARLACVGSACDATTLAWVLGSEDGAAPSDPWEALREGLIVRVGDGYRFAHDRIREAAYSLVPEESRPAEHLAIGRLLVARLPQQEAEERVFEVVTQLNQGIDLIADAAEREALRRLDARAGRRARASTAYASARGFLEVAVSLLAADAWSAGYDEAFALHLDLAECEYLAGSVRRADEMLEALRGRARSDLDRARVHLARITLYQGTGRFDEAWRAGLEGLKPFGVSFPEEPRGIAAAIESETRQIRLHLGGRRPADLADAPEMTSPALRMVVRLMLAAAVPAYNARPECHPLLICRAVSLSVLEGNAPESTLAYLAYSLVLVPLGQIAEAIDFNEAGRRLADRSGDLRARTYGVGSLGSLIEHWRNPVSSCVSLMDQGIRGQQELGELANAGILCIVTAWVVLFETGEPLDEALAASEKYLALAVESRNDIARDAIRLIRQLVPALKGTTRAPSSLDDDGFAEAACLGAFRGAGFGAGLALHRILRQVVAFLYGRYEEAFEAGEQQASSPAPASAFLYDLTDHFFRGLGAAALWADADPERQRRLRRILDEELQRHELWAGQCPGNFLHRRALLSAEAARLEGRDLDAMRLYEQAIGAARESGFAHVEALAWELASRFHRARGFDAIASVYLRQARACYLRWGADGKVRQIDQLHPQLTEPGSLAPAATLALPNEQLDMLAVVKASQAISGEIEVEKLVGTLLKVVLEQGGGRKGYLLLAHDGALSVEAEAILEGSGAVARVLPRRTVQPSSLVPLSVIQYARSTREPVILDDATAAPGRFAADPYFETHHPRSVLCLPVVRREEVGLLYLENDLAVGAFNAGRLTALRVLASQAAISMENALHLARAQDAVRQRDETLREVERLKAQLEEENVYLREEMDAHLGIGGIVGESNALKYVLMRIGQVASSDATVLIEGETGVGKELVARAVHDASRRAKGPFVRVNCAALPAAIVESELFGHEAGAFTGATRVRKGRFELADGGTLFLDEIGEMPLEVQAKLLRVLQEGELERVGGTRTLRVQVRVIAAANRPLLREVEAGRFREDLFYRLNVFPITVPPLRDRREDIPLLVRHFVPQLAARAGRRIREIPGPLVRALVEYDWPGNVRELRNVLERAVLQCGDGVLRLPGPLEMRRAGRRSAPALIDDDAAPPGETLEAMERRHIVATLRRTRGRVSGPDGAAVILGMNPNTLRSRMKKLGIRVGRSLA